MEFIYLINYIYIYIYIKKKEESNLDIKLNFDLSLNNVSEFYDILVLINQVTADPLGRAKTISFFKGFFDSMGKMMSHHLEELAEPRISGGTLFPTHGTSRMEMTGSTASHEGGCKKPCWLMEEQWSR